MKYKKLKNGKYKIIINDEEIITYDEIILKYNLLYKDTFNASIIKKENKYYDIYYKCINLINKKLRTIKEISEITPNEIVDRLIKEGYLNDLRYTKAFIHDKLLFSNDGPKMIKLKLIKKGISEDVINSEIDLIDKEILFSKIDKIKKKYEEKKATNYLLNKGYDYDMIKKNQE